MTLTLSLIQSEIRQKLDTDFVQPIYDTGIPTATTLARVNGKIEPYLVINFSDIGRGVGRNFAGARGDDYQLPVNIMTVAPTSTIAESLRVRVIDKMLGYAPQYAGEMNKRLGGGTFTVQNANGGIEAYVCLVSFVCTIQLLEV